MSLPFINRAANRQAALPPIREENGLLFGIGMSGILLAITGAGFLMGWGLANRAQIPAVPWYLGWGAFFAGIAVSVPALCAYHYLHWRRSKR